MIADIQQAILEAQAEIMEAMDAIQQATMKEQTTKDMRRLWVMMPDEMKEIFKQQQPDAYRQLMREMQIKRR